MRPLAIVRAALLAVSLSTGGVLATGCEATGQYPEVDVRGEGAEGTSRSALNQWECTTTGGGTQLSPTGRYYATSFGCWLDEDGEPHGDADDNCIPWCIDQDLAGCEGLSGKACEHKLRWFAAGERRYGCGTKLRVTNPENQKAVVVVVIDRGPNCKIEKKVQHWVADLSYPTTDYLFGEPKAATEKGAVLLEIVAATTPLGPVVAGTEPTPDPPAPPLEEPPADPGEPGCGDIGWEGTCQGDTVLWCAGDALQIIDCGLDQASCGWNDPLGYFDCVPASTGCGDLGFEGVCNGAALSYCNEGAVVSHDCSAYGLSCAWNAQSAYYDCM